jgi:small GTP-binding protein
MNRKQLEKELTRLPYEWQAAFAGRVATQALVHLLEKQRPGDPPFAYWSKTEQQSHLFAVLRASTFPTAESAYSAAARSAARSAALSAAISAAISAAESAASSALSAALSAEYSGMDTDKEFALLKTLQQSGRAVTEYIQQPLYSSQAQVLHQRGLDFVHVLRNYGSGFDLWADWFQSRMDGLALDQDFLAALVSLPDAILAQEVEAIHDYLRNSSQMGPLNQVRVIFLGDGDTGKTSLIRALNGLEVIEGKEPMTPGIDISQWTVPNTEITAYFWDFGGQVMVHATHQFFLRSQCLYLLLLNGRTEINTANEQAEYWLEHVRAFGKKAPVMLVGNKDDLCAVNLDMATLKEKHPHVIGFYPLSCTQYKEGYAPHFQRFQADIVKGIQELDLHTVRFGKNHHSVLNALAQRSSRESFLIKTAWVDLCNASGVTEQGPLNQKWLLDILDKLGLIIHFPELAVLDSYILNPRWLTYGVYTLLYSPEAKEKKGRLKKNDLVHILEREEAEDHLGNRLLYPAGKSAIIIEAMEQFRLCFRCRHENNEFVIPALLDPNQPAHGFKKKGSLAFEFHFVGFLPRHIMPSFIVGRHDEIVQDWVWQNGVVLERKNQRTQALVQVDYHDRKLFLWVHGFKANEYLRIIYDDLLRIISKMDIRSTQWVIVPEKSRIGEAPLFVSNEPIRADYKTLLVMEDKGRTEYDCEQGTFDLAQILQIMPQEARKEQQQEIHLKITSDIKIKDLVPETEPKGKNYLRHILDWRFKTRYFRVAWLIVASIFGMNALSMVEGNISSGSVGDIFLFKIGFQDQLVLSGILAVVAGVLFWLDLKENSKKP